MTLLDEFRVYLARTETHWSRPETWRRAMTTINDRIAAIEEAERTLRAETAAITPRIGILEHTFPRTPERERELAALRSARDAYASALKSLDGAKKLVTLPGRTEAQTVTSVERVVGMTAMALGMLVRRNPVAAPVGLVPSMLATRVCSET